MATINQSPAGQASVTLSGVSFNGITATATPVRIPARFTVQGGSFAVNLGAASVSLVGAAITLLDAPGDNAVSLATMAAAKITSTRNDRLVAVDDPSPGTLVHVGQSAAEAAKVAGSNRLVAVSNLSAGTLAAVQQDGMDVVVVAANP
jgi:hypothetical protein